MLAWWLQLCFWMTPSRALGLRINSSLTINKTKKWKRLSKKSSKNKLSKRRWRSKLNCKLLSNKDKQTYKNSKKKNSRNWFSKRKKGRKMWQREDQLLMFLSKISITNNILVTFTSDLPHRRSLSNLILDQLLPMCLPISVLKTVTNLKSLMSKKGRPLNNSKKCKLNWEMDLWVDKNMAMVLVILMDSLMKHQSALNKEKVHHVSISWKYCKLTKLLVSKTIDSLELLD